MNLPSSRRAKQNILAKDVEEPKYSKSFMTKTNLSILFQIHLCSIFLRQLNPSFLKNDVLEN